MARFTADGGILAGKLIIVMYGLLAIGFLLYFPLTLVNKLASKNTKDKETVFKFSLYNAAVGALIGFFVAALERESFSFDWITLSTAFFLGVTLAAYQVAMLYALKQASVAIVNMIITASVIFPCIFGMVFFHEPISACKIVGIIGFLIAAYFITDENDKKNRSFTWKSLLLCCTASLMSGLGSISMQVFSKYATQNGTPVFMFYSYCFNVLTLFVFVCILRKQREENTEKLQRFSKNLLIIGALSAVLAFFIRQINVVLANAIPEAILFPVLKSGSLIFGAVIGRFVFKENLYAKNMIGIVLCVTALIILNL